MMLAAGALVLCMCCSSSASVAAYMMGYTPSFGTPYAYDDTVVDPGYSDVAPVTTDSWVCPNGFTWSGSKTPGKECYNSATKQTSGTVRSSDARAKAPACTAFDWKKCGWYSSNRKETSPGSKKWKCPADFPWDSGITWGDLPGTTAEKMHCFKSKACADMARTNMVCNKGTPKYWPSANRPERAA